MTGTYKTTSLNVGIDMTLLSRLYPKIMAQNMALIVHIKDLNLRDRPEGVGAAEVIPKLYALFKNPFLVNQYVSRPRGRRCVTKPATTTHQ